MKFFMTQLIFFQRLTNKFRKKITGRNFEEEDHIRRGRNLVTETGSQIKYLILHISII